MKKIIPVIVFMFFSNTMFAQNGWFKTYTDSIILLSDANRIKDQFSRDIKKIKPNSKFKVDLIFDTTPNLIFINNDTIHLPLWEEVDGNFKGLLEQLAGGAENGKEVFGLFFNGFYLAHELGHGFQFTVEKRSELREYEMEYFANTISILWWRKQKKEAELKRCYEYAKIMLKDYPDPFPSGVDKKNYFSENYNDLQLDSNLFARIYPYVQFNQFIEIYEDKSLTDFDNFVKAYLKISGR